MVDEIQTNAHKSRNSQHLVYLMLVRTPRDTNVNYQLSTINYQLSTPHKRLTGPPA
ncbi:MAG: hypothetical protein ACRC62_12965 [Microcoleus sp.]